jgi:hypothetical protein
VHIAQLGGAHCSVELQLRPEIPADEISKIMDILGAFYQAMQEFGRERAALFEQDERYTGSCWPALAVC